jgi:hypothetical protein
MLQEIQEYKHEIDGNMDAIEEAIEATIPRIISESHQEFMNNIVSNFVCIRL